ncbi:Vps74 protein [Starmerella bacillaris]|uniref:Vps74 protein n=1 Tax=Starmerella bacillaris TaxID=1247836 RepID=A0AAV5RKM1_STABA|nr:Vps74 protein [Starmerella bacillaris]
MSVQRRRGAASSNTVLAPSSARFEEKDERKIAYDPEETARGVGSENKPLLTLMEEVLLLGLKDEEGVLSFWNDSISYVLRGCIMTELALQGKIAMINDPLRRQHALSERKVEVIDDRQTGEVLLDETLDLMKKSEPMSVNSWIDALSGETWNLSKIGYQLKQVRERLCKGLVDKKICRTEKRSYILFDMATHPVVDFSAKHEIVSRLHHLIDSSTFTPDFANSKWFPNRLPLRTLRAVCLATSAHAANVLENMYANVSYDVRDTAFLKTDEMLLDFSEYPFVLRNSNPWETSVFNAVNDEIDSSMQTRLEVIAAVLQTYTQLDSVV